MQRYNNLPIKGRGDIELNINTICNELNMSPGPWIKEVYRILEENIINGTLKNIEEDIKKYVLNKIDSILVKLN